jgi:hypothetical protein
MLEQGGEQSSDRKPNSRDRRHAARAFDRSRDGVAGHVALFLTADLRSRAARRFKAVISAFTADAGGQDHLSEARRQLIRRCAMLATSCEAMEAEALADGKSVDMDLYGRMVGHLRRTIETLGIDRRARDIDDIDLPTGMARW